MFDFVVPCLFGLEGYVADELRMLGMENVNAQNGQVGFSGWIEQAYRANLHLRCGERVLLRLGQFRAETFDQLFEGTRALPLEEFIGEDEAFPVKGHSLNSKLYSIPDCQKIIKKAAVERLKSKYKVSWFSETGIKKQLQFAIMKDEVSIYLDTTGAGLHKRGYRGTAGGAPIRETLAAAMVKQSRYKGASPLIDPFCGSGTILIEAALIAKNRAPGLYRKFACQDWSKAAADAFKQLKEESREKEYNNEYSISGFDIDGQVLDIARENTKKAGLGQMISYREADVAALEAPADAIIIANPPYGERLMDIKQAQKLYAVLGQKISDNRAYIISSDPEFELHFGKKAEKKRKLYNGMIKCDLYMYNINRKM